MVLTIPVLLAVSSLAKVGTMTGNLNTGLTIKDSDGHSITLIG